MKTVADFLVIGRGLAPLDITPMELPCACYDALYGTPINVGYPIWDVVSRTAGEYLDTLGNNAEFVSENTAIAFKNSWNMGAWLIFEDGTGHHPMISSLSAKKQGRLCWSDLVRDIWPFRRGQRALCILTTDFKKRLWPYARVGVLSEKTNIYLHNPDINISSNVIINWQLAVEYLDVVEEVYTQGFTMKNIAESLVANMTVCNRVGLLRALSHEKFLSGIRCSNEFKFACTIAQRRNDEN